MVGSPDAVVAGALPHRLSDVRNTMGIGAWSGHRSPKRLLQGYNNEMESSDGPPTNLSTDPIVEILLSGEARSVSEGEELYLDRHVTEIVGLVESPLSDREFREHPLIVLLLAHGSRGWEDSLT